MSAAPLSPELATAAEGIFEHLNGNHADSVVFLAGHVVGRPVVDAELVAVDAAGADLRVRDDEGHRTIRVEFSGPIYSTADLQGQLIGKLVEAREAAPDGPLTSIEAELASRDAIPTRAATVTAVAEVADGLRQITFGGLRGHRSLGPDDFYLVIRPKPGDEHHIDDVTEFGTLRALPEDQWPDWAYYTCRRWRPEDGELDAWFLLHDHDGPISGWAREAEVGDRVLLWGPRTAFEPPADTTSLLLVGDETGLGAFAAILEATAPDVAVTLIIESDDGLPIVELPEHPNATVIWADRDGAEHGTGSHLVDAVRALDLEVDGLYAYGAGESRQVTAVRKHLRSERGVPGPQVRMVAYWRRDA